MNGTSRGLPDPPELLARVLEHRGWSVRAGQLDMVESIHDALDIDEPERDASINAPTGTGKSLGYIISALPSDERIVVSTSTKALQDQIVRHELPRLAVDLKEMFDWDLTFAVLKGKSNYLCVESAKAFIGMDGEDLDAEDVVFDIDPDQLREDDMVLIRQMIERTEKAMEERDVLNLDCGDMLQTLPSMVQASINATKKCMDKGRRWYQEVDAEDEDEFDGLMNELGDDDSSTQRVPYTLDEIIEGAKCPYRMAYALALKADILVMNTSLLAAEVLKSQSVHEMVPQQIAGTGIVIVDEAHHLIKIVTGAMSQQVDFDLIAGSAEKLFKRLSNRRPDMEKRLSTAKDVIEGAHDELVHIIDNTKASKLREAISDRLRSIKDEIEQLVIGIDIARGGNVELSVKDRKVIASILSQVDEDIFQPIMSAVEAILTMSGPNDPAYDVTFAGGDEEEWLAIDMVPLDLSFFRDSLGKINMKRNTYIGHSGLRRTNTPTSALILCSGTITGEVARTIGVRGGVHHLVESPFDPIRQRICIPEYLPEPSSTLWEEEAWEVAKRAIEAAGGRTLFLTTSYSKLDAFKDRAMEELKMTILHQRNGMSRPELLREFAEDETSILFGTTSFWEGVDIPGPALSLVIIDKIMFPLPNDPVDQARRKWAEKNDDDPFAKVTVNHAATMMAQGVGRLIRSERDAGGILILDPRVVTKRYGPSILSSVASETPVCTYEDSFMEWLEWVAENPNSEFVPDPDPESWRPLRTPRKKRRSRA